MSTSGGWPSYVIVSPFKDEERYIELTLRSVVSQTRLPHRWVIVNDESTDGSVQIVQEFAAQHPFITLAHHQASDKGTVGIPEVRAFNFGFSFLQGQLHDVVVKLDCDLSFAPDYFEGLLTRFAGEPSLGIASGVYLELDQDGHWEPVAMPYYHAFGASKAVRRQCFEQIGGFQPAPGWDTIDEIRARCLGWNTRHFTDLEARHHKSEGARAGSLRTSRMHGEADHRSGGGPLWFSLKFVQRLLSRPVVLNGGALAAGYIAAWLRRESRLVTPAEAKYYRRLLNRRLVGRELSPVVSNRRTD